MNVSVVFRASFVFAAALAALSARAVQLDFEDLAPQGGNGQANAYGTPLATRGYVLTTSGLGAYNGGFQSFNPVAAANGYDYTGSIALFDATVGSFTTLTRAGGGAFDVVSLDLANLFAQSSNPGGATVGLLGTRADGTTTVATLTLAAQDGLQTRTLPGFTNLVSLRLGSQDAPFYQFDNVNVQAVPEPSTVAVLGLGAVTLLRRRKRA